MQTHTHAPFSCFHITFSLIPSTSSQKSIRPSGQQTKYIKLALAHHNPKWQPTIVKTSKTSSQSSMCLVCRGNQPNSSSVVH
eukprot:c16551_g1_i1 orf=278-523(-)